MNKKSKFLKNRTKTATYLTAIAAFVSFSGPLSAGWVRDDDAGANPPNNPRIIQVVFGKNHKVDDHPNHHNAFGPSILIENENAVEEVMRNIVPPIKGPTEIHFWVSRDAGTEEKHRLCAAAAARGAIENARKSAFITAAFGANVGQPAALTFKIRKKNP